MILYDDEMSWGHGDVYIVLRALMDGPVIEAVYGETMIHSIKAVVEMLAQEEWLGVTMIHHPWSTYPSQY